MRSPWITITFLAFSAISFGAPVADPHRKDADGPYYEHDGPHVDAHTHHGLAVEIGAGRHGGIHVDTKAKGPGAGAIVIGRSPQGLSDILGTLGGSAGKQPGMNGAPQGAPSFLGGLLGASAGPGPGAGAPARRSPQTIGTLLDGILGSQTAVPNPRPTANLPTAPLPLITPNLPTPPAAVPPQANPILPLGPVTPGNPLRSPGPVVIPNPIQAPGPVRVPGPILPRNPQDLSKILGIVFPPPPAPAPADSDSSNNRREAQPQLGQVTSLVTNLFTPPAPPASPKRRWLVDAEVASEASSDVSADAARKHKPQHDEHHEPKHAEHHEPKHAEHHKSDNAKHHKDDHPEHHKIRVVAAQGVPLLGHDNVALEGGRSPAAAANVHLSPGDLHVAAHSA